MRSSMTTLNDAVVIGYGTQKKTDLTGAVRIGELRLSYERE